MFERFTDESRHVVVQAQEAARELRHSYIGTEHLVLALAREELDTVDAIEALGFSRDELLARIEADVGRGKKPPKGHIPFTRNAKAALEQGLEVATGQGDRDIRPGHILGAIGQLPGCVAYRALDLDQVRAKMLMTVLFEKDVEPPQTQSMDREPDPSCAGCHASLADHLAHRVITSTDEIGQAMDVTIIYCRQCGTSLGAS